MDLKRLRMADTITGGAGIVLFLALFVVPWHDVAGDQRTALESPNGFIGLLILLITAFVVALVVLERVLDAGPELPREYHQLVLYLAVADAVLVLFKLWQETSNLDWGAWLIVALVIVMLYGAVGVHRAATEEDEVYEDWS